MSRGTRDVMVRWVATFAVALVLLCTLYYLVRVRARPEDEIKERRRRSADRTRPGPLPGRPPYERT